jgi:predicted RNA binding protein YcfA (HicA-like mRNA interferase family)
MQKEEKPLGKKNLLEKVLSRAIVTFFSAQSIYYGSRFIWKTLKMWEWEEVERGIQAGENALEKHFEDLGKRISQWAEADVPNLRKFPGLNIHIVEKKTRWWHQYGGVEYVVHEQYSGRFPLAHPQRDPVKFLQSIRTNQRGLHSFMDISMPQSHIQFRRKNLAGIQENAILTERLEKFNVDKVLRSRGRTEQQLQEELTQGQQKLQGKFSPHPSTPNLGGGSNRSSGIIPLPVPTFAASVEEGGASSSSSSSLSKAYLRRQERAVWVEDEMEMTPLVSKTVQQPLHVHRQYECLTKKGDAYYQHFKDSRFKGIKDRDIQSFLQAEKWIPMKRKAGDGSHFPFHHPTDANWVTGFSLHRDGITPRGLCIQIMRQMGLDTAGAEDELLGNDL